MIFATPSSGWAHLQNLPVAKETLDVKFPFILASDKEVGKLNKDKECLNCCQESGKETFNWLDKICGEDEYSQWNTTIYSMNIINQHSSSCII